MSDHIFLKEWKAEQIKLVKQVHPEYSEDKIKKVLNKLIDKRIKNPECAINNNYLRMQAMSTVLDIYDFIDKTSADYTTTKHEQSFSTVHFDYESMSIDTWSFKCTADGEYEIDPYLFDSITIKK